MDILHLNYFREVALQKSFTKASQKLLVSQPSISKVIKTLENELGVILLERSGREIELTDAGKAVLQRAQRVLFEFQDLETELADIVAVKKGEIFIGLPPMVGARFFPEVIAHFREAYPQVLIHLIEVGSKQVEVSVQEGTLDFGVIALPPKLENFEQLSLARESLRVVLTNDHVLSDQPVLTFDMLSQESFVLYREDFSLYDHIIEQCQQRGFAPRIACKSSQWDFIVEMVGAKLGIALLPERICKDLDPNRFRSIVLCDPIIPWHLAMIWKKAKYMSFAARKWLELTQKVFG